jgi:hypothetical protein
MAQPVPMNNMAGGGMMMGGPPGGMPGYGQGDVTVAVCVLPPRPHPVCCLCGFSWARAVAELEVRKPAGGRPAYDVWFDAREYISLISNVNAPPPFSC